MNDGIQFSTTCNGNTITGNTTNYNGGSGINLSVTNSNNTLRSNTASYNVTGGFRAVSSSNNNTFASPLSRIDPGLLDKTGPFRHRATPVSLQAFLASTALS